MLQVEVVVAENPEENAGVGGAQRLFGEARVLDGLPPHLQEQALLRVQVSGVER